MTKIEEVSAYFKDDLYVTHRDMRLHAYIVIDETNKLYFYRKVVSRGVSGGSRSMKMLPLYMQEFILANNGTTLDNCEKVVRVAREVSKEELRKLFSGYRTFQKANAIKTDDYRVRNELKSDVFMGVHESGIRLFCSRVKAPKSIPYSNLTTSMSKMLMIRSVAMQRFDREMIEKRFTVSKSDDWEITLVKTIDASDSRVLIRLLNDSVMAENMERLLNLEIDARF